MQSANDIINRIDRILGRRNAMAHTVSPALKETLPQEIDRIKGIEQRIDATLNRKPFPHQITAATTKAITKIGRLINRIESEFPIARSDAGESNFKEEDHPRAKDGRFGSKAASEGGKGKESKAEKKAEKGKEGQGEKENKQKEKGGEEKKGEKSTAKKISAVKYAAKKIDTNVTEDQILKNFPPDTAKKIQEINNRLAKTPETITKFKKNGEYTPERKKVHAVIIKKFLNRTTIQNAKPPKGEKPTFTILGGRGGSGKSWFKGNVYDPNKNIVLDSDAIKEMLPEYEGWNAASVHEESSDLFDYLTQKAQKLGLNIVQDATMKNTEKAIAAVNNFKNQGYRIEAHYMFVPPQQSAVRGVKRFLKPGGRFVPPGIILGNKTNENSFDSVKSLVDKWSFRDNSDDVGKSPKLVAEG